MTLFCLCVSDQDVLVVKIGGLKPHQVSPMPSLLLQQPRKRRFSTGNNPGPLRPDAHETYSGHGPVTATPPALSFAEETFRVSLEVSRAGAGRHTCIGASVSCKRMKNLFVKWPYDFLRAQNLGFGSECQVSAGWQVLEASASDICHWFYLKKNVSPNSWAKLAFLSFSLHVHLRTERDCSVSPFDLIRKGRAFTQNMAALMNWKQIFPTFKCALHFP